MSTKLSVAAVSIALISHVVKWQTQDFVGQVACLQLSIDIQYSSLNHSPLAHRTALSIEHTGRWGVSRLYSRTHLVLETYAGKLPVLIDTSIRRIPAVIRQHGRFIAHRVAHYHVLVLVRVETFPRSYSSYIITSIVSPSSISRSSGL